MGERTKQSHSNDDLDEVLCDSAVLIQHLSNDHDLACVTPYESCCNLKINKHQVKSFGSSSPVDVIGDACDFPIENIEKSICSNSSNNTHTSMLGNNKTTHTLVETPWVNKNDTLELKEIHRFK